MTIKRHKIIKISLNLLTGLVLATVFSVHEGPRIIYAAIEGPIECNGDTVEYFENEKKVVGTGNVVVNYEDVQLTCDKVNVWLETKDIEAEGNIRLVQGENIFEGESIKYNFEKELGSVMNVKATAPPWYARGKDAVKDKKERFVVNNCYVTTCDHEGKPHWKLSAKKVLIYPEVKLTTYNAIAWLNPLGMGPDIPVMWIPYYSHPLDDNRPHVTVIPGKSGEWGYYLLTAWRYNLTPNQKGYVHLDYREQKDAAVGVDYIYDTGKFGEGTIKTYYMNERDLKMKRFYHRWARPDDDFAPTTEEEKGLLRVRHRWEMAPNTLMTAELHKYKDESFLKDYFYNEYEKDEHPESYALLSNTNQFGSFTLLTRKRVNRFDSTTEVLPEAKFDIYNRRVFNSDFYYTANFKAVNINEVYPRHTDDNPGRIRDPQHNNIYGTYNQLSYKTKLGFLNITPYIGTNQTYFDREVDGDNSLIRGTAHTGVDVSTKFYKMFHTEASPFGIELNNIRHIITPTLSYNLVAPATVPSYKLFGDSISRSSVMALGLENKLQTKQGTDMHNVDLAMLLVNTTYDFSHTPGTQFGDYTAKLELKPFDWMFISSDAIIDPHKRYHHEWLKQLNNDLSFNLDNKFTFGLGHRYVRGSNSLIAQAQLTAIPGWRFSVYEDFDLLRRTADGKKRYNFREQEYVITKDLHCWEMDVRYNVGRNDGEEIMVIFRLKAFPELPFEFGKQYHRPKPGSQAYGK